MENSNNSNKKLNTTKVFIALLILVGIVGIILYATNKDPSTASSSESIKLGVQLALTGDIAVYGVPMRQGAELAAEEINKAGGIKGRKVELIFEDSKCDPKLAVTATEKLISVDKVSAIVGDLCSSSTLASVPVAEGAKVVMLSPSATSPKITTAGEYIFRDAPSDAYQGVEGVKLAEKLGLKKVAIIYENTEYGLGLKDTFTNEAAKREISITGSDTFEQNKDRDFRTQLTKLKENNPDTLYVVSVAAVGGIIMKQAKELGMNVQFIGVEGLNDKSILETAGTAAEGAIITTPRTNTDTTFQNFKAAYQAKYNDEPKVYVAETYDAVKILVEAVKKSDGTGTGIKNALNNLGSYSGASGIIQLDQNGDLMNKPYDFLIVRNGKFEPYTG